MSACLLSTDAKLHSVFSESGWVLRVVVDVTSGISAAIFLGLVKMRGDLLLLLNYVPEGASHFGFGSTMFCRSMLRSLSESTS